MAADDTDMIWYCKFNQVLSDKIIECMYIN
jgi:hypothetical protein